MIFFQQIKNDGMTKLRISGESLPPLKYPPPRPALTPQRPLQTSTGGSEFNFREAAQGQCHTCQRAGKTIET
jgi:hypothetical protein